MQDNRFEESTDDLASEYAVDVRFTNFEMGNPVLPCIESKAWQD